MEWKQLEHDLTQCQSDADVPASLRTLRRILSTLSLENGLGTGVSYHDCQREMRTVFAEVSKLVASKHPLVRKLAGWVVLAIGNDANFEGGDLHLLAVNSLIANGSHPDFVTRGKALTLSRQLMHVTSTEMAEHSPMQNDQAMKDCEYVRRLAVIFTRAAESAALVDMIETD